MGRSAACFVVLPRSINRIYVLDSKPMTKIELTKEEIFQMIQSAVSQVKHLKPSPETEKRLNDLQKLIEDHEKKEMDDLQGLMLVIYGDPKRNEIGMNQMTKDMHDIITQGKGVVSLFKIIAMVGVVSTFLYAFFKKIG